MPTLRQTSFGGILSYSCPALSLRFSSTAIIAKFFAGPISRFEITARRSAVSPSIVSRKTGDPVAASVRELDAIAITRSRVVEDKELFR